MIVVQDVELLMHRLFLYFREDLVDVDDPSETSYGCPCWLSTLSG